MEATDLSTPQHLVHGAPSRLVAHGNPPGILLTNDRFTYVFAPGQPGGPGAHRLALDPGSPAQSATSRHRDGRDVMAGAQPAADHAGAPGAFDNPGQALMQDNERLRMRITELEELSATDPLTGAWNRMQLERTVDVEIGRARRTDQPVTLVMLDLDHFKRANDEHGHLAGDAVLKEFVERIRKRMRQSDSLFRWGGDEFVVLATSVGYRGGAALAEGLRRRIAGEAFAVVGPLTASLGVAEYMEGESANEWFQRTDEALYVAKSAGRNRMHVDRRGRSDLRALQTGTGVLRLCWLDAYECGDATIDAEHRALFDLGNALIAAAIEPHAAPASWQTALDSMLAHLVRHFRDEEALMTRYRYPRVDEHRRAHAVLLKRAAELKRAVERRPATLGRLINFVVNDVIALHLLKIDRDFDLSLRRENETGTDRALA